MNDPMAIKDPQIIHGVCTKYNLIKDKVFNYIVHYEGVDINQPLVYDGAVYKLTLVPWCVYPFITYSECDNYIAYGDVNPIEHGGQWIKKVGENEYDVITINQLDGSEPPIILFGSAILDLKDSWINIWDVIQTFDSDLLGDEAKIALDVVGYYGSENCGGSIEYLSEEQVVSRLSTLGIEVTSNER